jgi:hypothetical protein
MQIYRGALAAARGGARCASKVLTSSLRTAKVAQFFEAADA